VIALGGFASTAPGTSLLEWGPLAHIGRISYGLYLWHIPLFSVLDPHLGGRARSRS
jgi:peptidoglycan/LPS O-acetylase OafA/YrhL